MPNNKRNAVAARLAKRWRGLKPKRLAIRVARLYNAAARSGDKNDFHLAAMASEGARQFCK